MWLGHKNQIDKINIGSVPVLSSTVSIVNIAHDLGVVIDSRLTMSDQVTALCRAGYYQLRQLRPVARSLPEESVKTLVHAFISSHLDYCNALLYGISDSLFRCLQSIQNVAVRFLTGASRRDLPADRGLQMPPASLCSRQCSHCSKKTLDLVTGVSRLRVREFGTVYRLTAAA